MNKRTGNWKKTIAAVMAVVLFCTFFSWTPITEALASNQGDNGKVTFAVTTADGRLFTGATISAQRGPEETWKSTTGRLDVNSEDVAEVTTKVESPVGSGNMEVDQRYHFHGSITIPSDSDYFFPMWSPWQGVICQKETYFWAPEMLYEYWVGEEKCYGFGSTVRNSLAADLQVKARDAYGDEITLSGATISLYKASEYGTGAAALCTSQNGVLSLDFDNTTKFPWIADGSLANDQVTIEVSLPDGYVFRNNGVTTDKLVQTIYNPVDLLNWSFWADRPANQNEPLYMFVIDRPIRNSYGEITDSTIVGSDECTVTAVTSFGESIGKWVSFTDGITGNTTSYYGIAESDLKNAFNAGKTVSVTKSLKDGSTNEYMVGFVADSVTGQNVPQYVKTVSKTYRSMDDFVVNGEIKYYNQSTIVTKPDNYDAGVQFVVEDADHMKSVKAQIVKVDEWTSNGPKFTVVRTLIDDRDPGNTGNGAVAGENCIEHKYTLAGSQIGFIGCYWESWKENGEYQFAISLEAEDGYYFWIDDAGDYVTSVTMNWGDYESFLYSTDADPWTYGVLPVTTGDTITDTIGDALGQTNDTVAAIEAVQNINPDSLKDAMINEAVNNATVEGSVTAQLESLANAHLDNISATVENTVNSEVTSSTGVSEVQAPLMAFLAENEGDVVKTEVKIPNTTQSVGGKTLDELKTEKVNEVVADDDQLKVKSTKMIDISVTVTSREGTDTKVHYLGSFQPITINLPAGINTQNLHIFHFMEDERGLTGDVEEVSFTIKDNKITLYVNSLSPFVFANYEEVSSSNNPGSNPPQGNSTGSSGNSVSAVVKTESTFQNSVGETIRAIRATDGSAAMISGLDSEVPTGAIITSSVITSGANYDASVAALKNAMGANARVGMVCEINLMKDGVAIHEMNGYVTVTIPKPAGFVLAADETLVVYRLESDGTLTKCATTVDATTLNFKTNHFSTYVFAIEKTAAQSNSGMKSPRTGETNGWNMLLVVMVAFAGMGLIYTAKRAREK